MMSKLRGPALFLCGVAGLAFVAPSTLAANYQLTPTFVGAFDPLTFEPIPGYDPYGNDPAILQFDVKLQVSGLQPGQLGFASVVFDLELEDVTDAFSIGWQATTPVIDSNGAAPGGALSLWAVNEDLGLQDLKEIMVAVANPLTTNPAIDPRWRLGQTSPVNLGSVFLDYDGTFVGFGFEPIKIKLTNSAYLNPNGQHIVDFIPEPTTAVLAGLALVGAAARRRV